MKLLASLIAALTLLGCRYIPGTDAYLVREAHRSVANQLNDEESARFRNERVIKKGEVCGEVNAKNGFGAYVGYRPYFYDGSSKIALLPKDGSSDELSTVQVCIGGPVPARSNASAQAESDADNAEAMAAAPPRSASGVRSEP